MYKHRAYLECQVSRASAKVTWYKNKSELRPSKKHEITSEDIYRKLTIIDVDSDDEDTYMCDAIDDKTSCQLLVEGKKTFSVMLSAKNIAKIRMKASRIHEAQLHTLKEENKRVDIM